MSKPARLQGPGRAPGARSQGQDLNSQLTGNLLAHSSHAEGLELALLVENGVPKRKGTYGNPSQRAMACKAQALAVTTSAL